MGIHAFFPVLDAVGQLLESIALGFRDVDSVSVSHEYILKEIFCAIHGWKLRCVHRIPPSEIG